MFQCRYVFLNYLKKIRFFKKYLVQLLYYSSLEAKCYPVGVSIANRTFLNKLILQLCFSSFKKYKNKDLIVLVHLLSVRVNIEFYLPKRST